MQTWTIEEPPSGTKKKKRSRAKGRTFEVGGLGALVKPAGGGAATPRWLVFAAEDGAVRPVLANLSLGLALVGRIARHWTTFAFRRSGAELAVKVQRVRDGVSVVTIAEEGLFVLDPGPVNPGVPVEFVSMTDAPWRARCGLDEAACRRAAEEALQAGELDDAEGRMSTDAAAEYRRGRAKFLAALVPAACHAVAMLDYRVAAPILPGPGFALYLLLRAIGAGLAAHCEVAPSSRWTFDADPAIGADPPIVFFGEYEEVIALIGAATQDFIA